MLAVSPLKSVCTLSISLVKVRCVRDPHACGVGRNVIAAKGVVPNKLPKTYKSRAFNLFASSLPSYTGFAAATGGITPAASGGQEGGSGIAVYVWGDSEKKALGACPVCHETLLFLEEKDVPYDRKFVDYANLPTELKKQSEGDMPILKDNDAVITGLKSITGYVEDKFPEPALGKGEGGDKEDRLTEELWQAFLAYLGSGSEQEQSKLNEKLTEVAHILEETRGPYIGADYVSATDVKLAPRLRHILIALPSLKDWSLPEKGAPAIHKFLDEFSKRASWKNTGYSDDDIVSFWKDRPSCTE
eukprot:jgi/Botrbrau1/7461/Bobra.0083s0026.1